MEAVNKNPLKASVWMITYNHEKYISQAIESALSQVTNFSFELVIGEDCSKDNTRAICLSYQERYPHLIKLLDNKTNVGIHKNLILTLEACKGQYVAMLEGDDYWTDKNKLQKQIDFLDANPDFVMCYQKTLQIDEINGSKKITNESDKAITGIEEILSRGWFMRTGSLAFRNGLLGEFPRWYFEYTSTDYMLHILIAQHGKIGFLNEVTSVYRRHEGGITQEFEEIFIEHYRKKQELLNEINKYFGFKYNRYIQEYKKNLYNACFIRILRHPHSRRDVVYLFRIVPFLDYRKLMYSIYQFFNRRM
jgi:glycosyltransferase involved in cell wall biosynthesis